MMSKLNILKLEIIVSLFSVFNELNFHSLQQIKETFLYYSRKN